MRAPDHEASGGEGGGDAGSDAGADAGDAGEGSLMGDIGSEGGNEGDKSGEGEGATGGEGEGEKGQAGEGEGDAGSDGEGDGGLPEKYELAPPEGYDAIDQAMLETADPIFRELGLGNEQAQKLVNLVPQIQHGVLQQQSNDFAALSTAWAKEAKADPHMGGANWKETETLVAKAKDLAATKLPPIKRMVDGKEVEISGKQQVEEFNALLNDTRLGNHPTMLRLFRFFGQAISEDSDFIRADGGAQVKKSREAILYPDDVRGKE